MKHARVSDKRTACNSGGRCARLVCAAALTLSAGFGLRAAQPDAVLDAMQAELKRSMTLKLNQLDKPYYLSYTVDDEHSWSASASLGGLISSNVSDFRVPHLRLRVGDYKFDNSNWTGANASGPRYNLRSFPRRRRESAGHAPVSLAGHRFGV